jgi:hypothetical protein
MPGSRQSQSISKLSIIPCNTFEVKRHPLSELIFSTKSNLDTICSKSTLMTLPAVANEVIHYGQ